MSADLPTGQQGMMMNVNGSANGATLGIEPPGLEMVSVQTEILPTPEAPLPDARGLDELGRLALRLQRLQRLRNRCGIFGQPASQADIRSLRGMLADRLDGDVAPEEVALAVQAASPNSIWSLYGQHGLRGGVAFLPLNTLGVYRLIYGKLDTANPGLECLAVRSEKPTVLYVWGVVAEGRGLLGLSDVLHHLDTQRFRNVDIWTCPVSERGERLAENLGLQRFAHGARPFYKLVRSA